MTERFERLYNRLLKLADGDVDLVDEVLEKRMDKSPMMLSDDWMRVSEPALEGDLIKALNKRDQSH